MTVWQIAIVVAAAALLLLLVVAVLALRTLRQIRSLLAAGAANTITGHAPVPAGVPMTDGTGPFDRDPGQSRVTVAARRQDMTVTGRPMDERRMPGPEVPTTITAEHTDRPDRLTPPRITSGAVVHGFRTAFAAARSRRETAEAQAAAGRSRRVPRGGSTERVGQQR